MSFSIPSSQIILRLIWKSDGKTMSMNIAENEDHKVEYVKSQVKHLFHLNGKFHLHYNGRHKLSYYDTTSTQSNLEIILA